MREEPNAPGLDADSEGKSNLRTEGCSGVGRMQLEGAFSRLGLVVRGRGGRQRKDSAAGWRGCLQDGLWSELRIVGGK